MLPTVRSGPDQLTILSWPLVLPSPTLLGAYPPAHTFCTPSTSASQKRSDRLPASPWPLGIRREELGGLLGALISGREYVHHRV